MGRFGGAGGFFFVVGGGGGKSTDVRVIGRCDHSAQNLHSLEFNKFLKKKKRWRTLLGHTCSFPVARRMIFRSDCLTWNGSTAEFKFKRCSSKGCFMEVTPPRCRLIIVHKVLRLFQNYIKVHYKQNPGHCNQYVVDKSNNDEREQDSPKALSNISSFRTSFGKPLSLLNIYLEYAH